MPERREITFPSQGDLCAGWYLRGRGDAFAGDAGRPCVVMAHGIGGTGDSGLLPFAEAFAGAGLDVVLFDYRCFGGSTGEPRQLGTPERHRDDYRAAVELARSLEGVDPERIVLWGTSWSGGHVVYVAADDPRIAAVISQTPDMDGLRTLWKIYRYSGPAHVARVALAGLRDALGALRGGAPHMLPVAARPGEPAALATEDSLPGYEAIAGPDWRNQIAARAVLAEVVNRPVTRVGELACPILIQIAERDDLVPAGAAEAAAWKAKGRSEVRAYPCAHFDIYTGEWRERSISDQLHFLGRHLTAGGASARESTALT